MKFRYKKYGSGVIRPIIPLKVAYGNKTIAQEVLVDSGADVCLFDAEVGAYRLPVGRCQEGQAETYRLVVAL